MKSIFAIGILPLFLWSLFAPVPDDAGIRMLKGLKKWHEENPQEKVFVQLDREKYIAGETIWLKAWATMQKKPTFLSRIVYLELTDAKGIVIDKKMFQLDNSASLHGALDLSKELPTGTYAINAYTSWMLNYPQFVYRKTIQVYGIDFPKLASITTEPKFDVQFFPEGGDLVEGLKSKIGVKVTNSYGLPVHASGVITTTAGEKVAQFTTEHDGMTSFELQPSPAVAYTASVEIGNKKYTYKLPAAKPEGVVMQVTNSSASRLFLQIQTSEKGKEKYNRLFAIAHMNGVAVFKGDFKPAEGENATAILKKGLPAGILHVTLFDTLGKPLAERLAFIANHEIHSPNLIIEQKSTTKRGLNTIRFKIDSVSNPNLSFAVTDAGSETTPLLNDGLASSLLLTSDLKGYINKPGYYFADKSATTLQHLDLLLLTQGWRRFNWKQIAGDEKIALSYPVETNLTLKGKVTKSDRKDIIQTGTVSFIIKAEDSTTILSTAKLTDKGEFFVDSLLFRKKATVSYEGNNAKNSLPVDVHFYPAYIDSLKTSAYSPYTSNNWSESADSTILNKLALLPAPGKNVLEGVTIKTKRKTKADSLQGEYVSPMYENSDQSLVPENTTYANIWQYMNAQIPGFSVNPFQPGGVTSAIFNRNVGINAISEDANSDRSIQFVLNEIPVTADVIDGLLPSDVALIKVYKGALAFPFGSDGGAISVYTKKGVGSGKPGDKRFASFKKIGFEFQREFYAPSYANYNDIASTELDRRITLLWKPTLKMEKDGSYKVSFYNNDSAKKFRLIIQGMDENGELIYKEQIIQ
ncbi:MAG TPA: MG2 domain-containing protein [Flavisolibacter sp.]|nr:MG2 domain-containing protein [Flavisolibacter sp.]